jgi:hypothetical protein
MIEKFNMPSMVADSDEFVRPKSYVPKFTNAIDTPEEYEKLSNPCKSESI